jgi:hypothetical protein
MPVGAMSVLKEGLDEAQAVLAKLRVKRPAADVAARPAGPAAATVRRKRKPAKAGD